MPLIDLPQAKAYLNLTTTAHDAELQGHVDAAIEAIEGYLGKVVEPRTITEAHQVRGDERFLVLRRHPVTSLTAVTVDGVALDLAGVELDPETGIVEALTPRTLAAGRVRVTYLAGPATVSAAHQRAAEIIVGNLFESQRIGAGPQAGPVSADEELVTDAFGVAIPPRARELLGPPSPFVA